VASAATTHLRYATDEQPGISREQTTTGPVYRRPDGRPVTDDGTRARIRTLAIPPAWTDVWISRDPRGHLQATGRDARGRKQYRYHAQWTSQQDAAKYDRLLAFAYALPAVRRIVAQDLAAPPLSRSRVLATVIALLERTHIRIGNEAYARANGSYGLTTLKNGHVRVRGPRMEFRFRGKSGVRHVVALDDPALARDVRRCQELPGQVLFEYRDESGRVRRVSSTDVNRYLGALATDIAITAKDFRTWWGTMSAAIRLRDAGPAPTATEAARTVNRVLDAVAAELGNTRAVCRKGYVHPDVIAGYLRGVVAPHGRLARVAGLHADEQDVLALLTTLRRQTPGARSRHATRAPQDGPARHVA
jgi:DNA topoisomerase-1